MVVKRQCSFCAGEIEPGTGSMFVKRDGTVFHFCSASCRKQQLHLGRVGHRFKWTRAHALKRVADMRSSAAPKSTKPAKEPSEPDAPKDRPASKEPRTPEKKSVAAEKPPVPAKEKESSPAPSEPVAPKKAKPKSAKSSEHAETGPAKPK